MNSVQNAQFKLDGQLRENGMFYSFPPQKTQGNKTKGVAFNSTLSLLLFSLRIGIGVGVGVGVLVNSKLI